MSDIIIHSTIGIVIYLSVLLFIYWLKGGKSLLINSGFASLCFILGIGMIYVRHSGWFKYRYNQWTTITDAGEVLSAIALFSILLQAIKFFKVKRSAQPGGPAEADKRGRPS